MDHVSRCPSWPVTPRYSRKRRSAQSQRPGALAGCVPIGCATRTSPADRTLPPRL